MLKRKRKSTGVTPQVSLKMMATREGLVTAISRASIWPIAVVNPSAQEKRMNCIFQRHGDHCETPKILWARNWRHDGGRGWRWVAVRGVCYEGEMFVRTCASSGPSW